MTPNPIRRAIRATAFVGALAVTMAGGLAASGTAAQAGSITVSDTLFGSASNVSTASIQKFDTALGTLDKVRIQYDLSVALSALFVNRSTTPGTATLADNRLRLNGNNRDIFDTSLPFGEISSQVLGGDIAINPAFALPNGFIVNGTTSPTFGFDYDATFDSDGLGITPGTFFSFSTGLFEGAGNFEFDFTATLDSPLSFSGFQPFLAPNPPIVSGTVTVTYEFTEAVVVAIPAPAALPVLAMGLAAFGLLRRRRQNG